MSTESLAFQPPAPAPAPRGVRWTFVDLLLVAALTLGLGGLALLIVRLLGQLGLIDLSAALASRPLVFGMAAGGLIYLLAVLATGLVIVRRGRGSWREIGFRAPPLLPLLLIPALFVAQMTALIIVNAIVTLALGQFENPQVGALTDPRGFSWANFAAVFFVGAIVAPIVEELLFRGLLYQWLRSRMHVGVAVLASAAIFSAAHVLPILFPALFAVGLVLTLVFEWSRSLWITIALHFLQNALGISAIFYLQANPQLLPQV